MDNYPYRIQFLRILFEYSFDYNQIRSQFVPNIFCNQMSNLNCTSRISTEIIGFYRIILEYFIHDCGLKIIDGFNIFGVKQSKILKYFMGIISYYVYLLYQRSS